MGNTINLGWSNLHNPSKGGTFENEIKQLITKNPIHP
jgi:hypothetical protein